MVKRRCKDAAASDVKRKKNYSRSELEVLLQEVNRYRAVIFSSVNSGYKLTQRKGAWDAITRSVNAVSGELRTSDEVKKKWFDIKSEAKKKIAKYRREVLTTGGICLSELDQRIGAIIGETEFSGLPSADYLDTDLRPLSALSSPCKESEDELLLTQVPSDEEPGPSQPVPSYSSTSMHAHRSCSTAPCLLSEAFLENQERMAQTFTQIASTLATISETLKEINTNLKK